MSSATIDSAPTAAREDLAGTRAGTHRRQLVRSGSWPAIILAAAVGVLIVGLSYRFSAEGRPAALYYPTFWIGMLLAVLPAAALLLSFGASRADRLWAVAVIGAVTAAPKYLRNPTMPLYHDEYAHWREATDVLSTGQLLRPNSLIPIVQFFPGTSGLTATVKLLTGMTVWSSGILVVFAAHLLALFAVVVLAQVHLRSTRAAGIAALVYALNPSEMYFDTQYAYESIAIALFLWVLALASLAARTPNQQRRIGLTVASILCGAGCVVTHHLTTLFLLMLLLLIVAVVTVRGRQSSVAKRQHAAGVALPVDHSRQVWWSVLGGTVMIGGLWLVLVAWPTVSYLSPYFGGSVDQLVNMASKQGDGGRQLLAASVQPVWERALTALAPLVVAGFAFLGLRILRKERPRWSSDTLALMAFGLLYFVSVPFILAPSGAEGARRSWAFTYVGISLLVALVVSRRARAARVGTSPKWRLPLALAVVSVVLIGNVGGGLNDPYRFPGPFRWGTDTNSASAEARTVAEQLSEQAGPVRVVTDAYTALQLVAYGGLDVAAPSAGFPAWDLTQTGTDPSRPLAEMLYSSHYDYLVVDDRMAQEPAFNGHNYGAGDPLLGQATPQSYLDRLDQVPWASRIISTEHLRVYRLDLLQLGAIVKGES